MATIASLSSVAISSIFTPPPSCSNSWTYEAETYNGITSGILLQNAFDSDRDVDCFPENFDNVGRAGNDQVFSPGFCPDKYTAISPTTVVGPVTTATCCYENFSFGSRDDFSGCLSSFDGSTNVAARDGGFGSADSTTSTAIEGTFTMWAQSIVVAYQESDMHLYTTPEPTSTTSSVTSEPTESNRPDSDSSGLSAGAIAGIVIGAVVGVLLLVGTGFWVGRRKRTAKAQLSHEVQPEWQHQNDQYKDQPQVELDSSQNMRYELPGH